MVVRLGLAGERGEQPLRLEEAASLPTQIAAPGLGGEANIAPQASDRITVTHGLGQARRGLAQQFIARLVSQRVVDLLEVIEIDEHQEDLAGITPRALDGLRQAV